MTDNNEQDALVKQLLHSYMNNQLEALNDKQTDKNNSFIFMENDTLHMLMLFMLKQLDNPPNQEPKTLASDEPDTDTTELSAYLDDVIEEEEIAFQEIIRIMKE